MKTNEQYISEAKEKYGDLFDYGEVNYTGADKPIILRCVKHDYKFKQGARCHLRGRVGCFLCFEEKYGRKPNRHWTYERCYEIAKKYEWLSDFVKNGRNVYDISLKQGYIKDFTWLKRHYDENETIIIARKHYIYGYFFPEFNAVYVGLTMNLEKRHKGHCRLGSVFNFCQDKGVDIPKPIIIESDLTLEESKSRECYWIDYYRELGYNLLNKHKGGSIGFLNRVMVGNGTEVFINKARVVHGNVYDYSKVVYKNCKTKICIICPIHGEFWQTPQSHLFGRKCKYCSGFTDTDIFVQKSIIKHGDIYDYSNVDYKGSVEKVNIMCKKHGLFQQSPRDHLQGCGCPKCGLEKNHITKRKWGYNECKEESKRYSSRKEFHDLSPSAYKNSVRYGWIEEFIPIKRPTKFWNSSSREQFIDNSKKVHGDKYDYSKVEYVNSKTKVCIICSKHGEFWQLPSDHKRGCGCIRCGIERGTPNIVRYRTKWTYERCKEAGQTCNSRKEFEKKFRGAYERSRRNGWLDEFFPKKKLLVFRQN